MRWFPFALVVMVLLACQSAVAPRVELFGARPDWLLVAVAFFALHAPARDAVLGSWIIGVSADLMTLERFGLIAVSYLVVATGIVLLREYVFRYRALTQFLVVLAACCMIRIAWMVYRRSVYTEATSALAEVARDVVLASIYTAVWAPLLHHGLLSLSGVFGFARPRYSYAGLHRAGNARV